jgi:hypothetical protein
VIIDDEDDSDPLSSITYSTSILDIQYFVPDESSPRLIVGFAHKIMILNTVTFDIVFQMNMGHELAPAADGPSSEQPIPMASAYHFCYGEENFIVSSSKMAQSSTVLRIVDTDTKINLPKSEPISPHEDEELSDYVRRVVSFQLKGNWAGILHSLMERCRLSRRNDESLWNRRSKHPKHFKNRKSRGKAYCFRTTAA